MEPIKPEKLADLSPERRGALITRSMEDISDIYEETRAIVRAVQKDGDQVALKHYTKNKADITLDDLRVQPEEVKAAYGQVEKKVVEALRAASRNIEKFHRAQIERDMWTVEIRKGSWPGGSPVRWNPSGPTCPGARPIIPPASS